jgi:hypothetical protein
MKAAPRNVSTAVLDFMFGEPLPVPDVVVEDSAEAWQRWLNAVADQEAVVEFEPTHPTGLN